MIHTTETQYIALKKLLQYFINTRENVKLRQVDQGILFLWPEELSGLISLLESEKDKLLLQLVNDAKSHRSKIRRKGRAAGTKSSRTTSLPKLTEAGRQLLQENGISQWDTLSVTHDSSNAPTLASPGRAKQKANGGRAKAKAGSTKVSASTPTRRASKATPSSGTISSKKNSRRSR